MRRLTIQFLLLLLPIYCWSDHAIYIAVVEVKPVTEATEVSIKVFSDDLENVLKNIEETLPGSPTFAEEATDYFNQHLLINLDGEAVQLIYGSHEIIGDSHWLYFTAPSDEWRTVKVSADFFTELFPTQQNVVRVSDRQGNQLFCRLGLGNLTCELTFN